MELLRAGLIIILLIGTPLVIIITYLQVFHKGKINFKGLEEVLQGKVEWRFPLQFVIEGTYKGREVTSILFPYMKISPLFESQRGMLHNFRTCFTLFMKPNKDLRRKDFLYICDDPKKLTEFAVLRYDGNIYYIKTDVANDCRGFWIGGPRLDYEKDKRSLFALYGLKLRREDILFFLDELEKAAKIAESGN